MENNNTETVYPIGGYAPGNYQCRCCTCGKFFKGDKRAVQCELCANDTTKVWIAAMDTDSFNYVPAERDRKAVEHYNEKQHPKQQLNMWLTKEAAQAECDEINAM
jgi:hypothetical protein